jgi:hypothetical protein
VSRRPILREEAVMNRLDALVEEAPAVADDVEHALRALLRLRARERRVRLAAIEEPLGAGPRRLLSVFEGQDTTSAYGALEHWAFVRASRVRTPSRSGRLR